MKTTLALCGAILIGGCATTETPKAGATAAANEEGRTEQTITAEQNDAIDAIFKRKASQLQSCWQEEYARTQNRKLEGDLLVALTVTPSGKPADVKVLKSTIESREIEACVVKEVASWAFPESHAATPYRRTVHLGAQF
jgi:outer membrane biosynthesis protein TonB